MMHRSLLRNVISTAAGVLLVALLQSCSGSKEAVKADAVTDKQQEAAAEKNGSTVLPDKNSAAPIVLIGKKGIDEAFPCVSPDSSRMAFQRRALGGSWQIWQYEFARDTATVILEHGGNAESPSYSPDGSRIVFTSDADGSEYPGGLKSRDLYIMDSDGHNLKKLTDSKSDNWCPFFSVDGKKIFFASNRNDSEQKYYDEISSLFVYALSSAKIDEVLPTVEYKNNPALSPDGKVLAFTNKENKLEIVTLETGLNGRVLTDGQSQSGGACFDKDGKAVFFHNFKNNGYEILCYFTDRDSSVSVVSNLANARSPFVAGGKIYFHSNQRSDYDIYTKNLK